jgi:protein-tyrosine-phosphatase
MLRFLADKKIPAPEHAARVITSEEVAWADLIIVMDRTHYNYIAKRWPEAGAKVKMLGGYISPDHPDDEIIDPYSRSPYHYRLVQSQILLAVSNLVRTLG